MEIIALTRLLIDFKSVNKAIKPNRKYPVTNDRTAYWSSRGQFRGYFPAVEEPVHSVSSETQDR